MSPPESPPSRRVRVPTWFDPRLLLGLLFVLLSVLVGSKIVASADQTVQVWAAASDLSAGTVLRAEDVRPVSARLVDNSSRYLSATNPPVGRVLNREIGRDELVPAAAVLGTRCGDEVSLPVTSAHVPASVKRGARVDIYATDKGGNGGIAQRVVAQATVQDVLRPQGGLLGSQADLALLLRVPSEQVSSIVKALRTSEIDVVVVTSQKPEAAECPHSESSQPHPSVTPTPSPSPRRVS